MRPELVLSGVEKVVWFGVPFTICPNVNHRPNKSPTFRQHVIHFPECSLCVPMCSCGVLRGVKQDGAPADGDDELHPRLPHPPLGGHGHALLEASLLDSCLGHSSHPCWMEVSLAKHKKKKEFKKMFPG